MLAKNVVKLDNVYVYDQIEKYLTKLSYNSKKTEQAYRQDIQMFFKLMRDKEINHLTKDDVQLSLDDFEDFISKLYKAVDKEGNRTYSNKTINRKISSVKGVTRYLCGKKIVDDISYMELIDSLPENSNSYGVLEASEVFKMAELCLHEREKGDIKRLALLFLMDTCMRKGALLNLKWSDFQVKEDGVLVKWIDKGNKDFRQMIGKDFYEELLTIKTDSEKVFDISVNALHSAFDRLKTKMNISEDRRITLHSVRKSGITYRYRITGDILEAQKAAGHSRIDTTRLYLQEEDYGIVGAVSSGGKIDNEMYKKVDNELLVNVIDGLKKDMKLIINMKIQELLKQNK